MSDRAIIVTMKSISDECPRCHIVTMKTLFARAVIVMIKTLLQWWVNNRAVVVTMKTLLQLVMSDRAVILTIQLVMSDRAVIVTMKTLLQ